MYKEIKLKRLYYVFLIPLGILLSIISSKAPEAVEAVYSTVIYKIFIYVLSFVNGIFPFSIAEVIMIFLVIFIAFNIIKSVLLLFSSHSHKYARILNKLINALVVVSLLYFIFIIIWGLNYHRLPFSALSKLNVENPKKEELKLVCMDLIAQANELRYMIKEDSQGAAQIQHGHRQVINRAPLGYSNASNLYSFIGGKYSKAKGVFFSRTMSHMGISGIYMPFTGEANVNISIPDSMLPCTVSHEMAHQRGFAREDEANYIAYLTCKLHPDIEFRYSGILLALIHAMNALYESSPAEFASLRKTYSDSVNRDLKQISDYWKQFEGPTEKLQNKINDAYLKSNLQEEGVKSYGRMVDLLIGEYRNSNSINN